MCEKSEKYLAKTQNNYSYIKENSWKHRHIHH